MSNVRPIWTAPKDCPDCGHPMYYSTAAGGHVHDQSGGFICDKDRKEQIDAQTGGLHPAELCGEDCSGCCDEWEWK